MTGDCNLHLLLGNGLTAKPSSAAEQQRLIPLVVSLLAMCIALGCVRVARAEDPGNPSADTALVQSLFIADAFNIQDRSEVQLTVGTSLFRGRGVRAAGGSTGMEYGITDRLQADFSLPFVGRYSTAETTQHIREINLGLSYAVRREATRFAIMPQVHFSHEYGSEPGTAVKVEPGVIVAQQLGATALHLGASRSITSADAAYSAALVRAWRDWRGTFELSHESDGTHAVVQVAPGLIHAGRGKLREVGRSRRIRNSSFRRACRACCTTATGGR